MSSPVARGLAGLLAVCALAAAGVAQALDFDRPHSWFIELRASTVYYPDADANVGSIPFTTAGGQGKSGPPFQDLFGTKHRLLTELEIDRELWRDFGTLSLGLAGGYSEFYGAGFRMGSSNNLVRSQAESSFHVVPLRLLATYRFDYFVPRHVPFVPFVRGGLDWVIYWNAMQDGQISFIPPPSNAQSLSMTTGVEGSVGLALLLDILDPGSARDFFEDIGVAHTYLLVEYTDQLIENGPGNLVHALRTLGQPAPPAIDLSARFFDFGLGFQF